MTRPVLTHPNAYPTASFRALDGAAELAVAEAAMRTEVSRPARITAVLAAALEEIHGEPATPALVRRVSSAGREWLLQRAVSHFRTGLEWFEGPCSACGAMADLMFSIDEVPRTAPGAGFPAVEIGTTLGLRSFEAPNGYHEERFALQPTEDPRRVFAALCGLSETAEADATRFDADDLARIDMALEEMSPEIADRVSAVCAVCGERSEMMIDPLGFAFPSVESVLRDVHLIARAYGWSEEQILAMPIARRQAYVSMIRTDAGLRQPQRRQRLI
jgi:hypothetical protein